MLERTQTSCYFVNEWCTIVLTLKNTVAECTGLGSTLQWFPQNNSMCIINLINTCTCSRELIYFLNHRTWFSRFIPYIGKFIKACNIGGDHGGDMQVLWPLTVYKGKASEEVSQHRLKKTQKCLISYTFSQPVYKKWATQILHLKHLPFKGSSQNLKAMTNGSIDVRIHNCLQNIVLQFQTPLPF